MLARGPFGPTKVDEREWAGCEFRDLEQVEGAPTRGEGSVASQGGRWRAEQHEGVVWEPRNNRCEAGVIQRWLKEGFDSLGDAHRT